MHIKPSDLVDELSSPGGEKFEAFMYDLIKAEAGTHGISPRDIYWDHRTSVRDGGCDIYVRRGHGQADPRFIPAVPSMWSIKGGKDGTEANTIRKELTASSHELVRQHIENAGVFVWCPLQPVNPPDREKIRNKVVELAQEMGFDSAMIDCRWIDSLASLLQDHPNLIVRHLPNLARRLEDVLSLEQWHRESPDQRGFDVNWVDFAGRDSVKSQIQSHLLSKSGASVLHIAGTSGIGKTRTAVQACQENKELRNTLYVPRYADLRGSLFRHIEEPGRYVRLIIDEVPLADFQLLSDRFRDCGDRIRIVTIGPMDQGQRLQCNSRSVIVLPDPPEAEDVFKVVKEAASGLSDAVLASIAQYSSHDLRLALLLVRATEERKDFRFTVVLGMEDVWKRVTSLFCDSLEAVPDFKKLYGLLTAAIDVGRDGEHRCELEYIAKHFEYRVSDLHQAIDAAERTRLGLGTPQFFEATPRALAAWIFANRLWPALAPKIGEFLRNMPTSRLRRRFLERCHEVGEPCRTKILDRVGRVFRTSLGNPSLASLSDHQSSRVFEAWAELDPDQGLKWLIEAVERASDDDLRALDGKFQAGLGRGGGWGGRRQVIWLCEHLACFKEHFWQCERILFRLAQVETEESIGNNSRNTWRAMFLPVLSNTEVPFAERLELLLTRLRDANEKTIDLLVSAGTDILGYHGAREAPPTVVGGRIVPAGWRPRTWTELAELEAEAGRKLLIAFGQLRPDLRRTAQIAVASDLIRFVNAGLVPELRSLMSDIANDVELLRILRAAVDSVVSLLVSDGKAQENSEQLSELRQWHWDIRPLGLRERIIDLTARDYWSVYFYNSEEMTEDDRGIVFRRLAHDLLGQLSLLAELCSWFSSEQCRSGGPLGFEFGRQDARADALPTILVWLGSAKAVPFASGYLRAVSLEARGLPQDAIPLLAALTKEHPDLAVQLSVESDCSEHGFDRIMDTLDNLVPGQVGLLRPMAFNSWPEVLNEEQKNRLLTALTKSEDPDAMAVAFELLAGWTEHGKKRLPDHMADAALRMLHAAAQPNVKVGDYNWKIVIGLLAERFPGEVAALLADAITNVKSRQYQLREYAKAAFKRLAATAPNACMQAIGRWVIDSERGPIFNLWEFRGLFDAIGLKAVRLWVEQHGPTAAIRIARHLTGPNLDDDGQLVVPQLANWLLTAFEKEERVFREFCMGRHSGIVRCGHAREQEADINRLITALRQDSRSWVRELAEYEKHNWESQVKWDDQDDAEMERL